jgi:hypothetical protein
MSKSKMHKQEVGKSRPTENYVTNAMTRSDAEEWVAKIDSVIINVVGVNSQLGAVSHILVDLINLIKIGKVDEQVLLEVMRRRNVTTSLQLARKIIERSSNGTQRRVS